MLRSHRSNKRLPVQEKPSVLFWLIGVIVLGFLFIAPFFKGLFNGNSHVFDGPINIALVMGSILLLLLSIYLFTTWKIQDNRNEMALFIWLIPLTYVISSFAAASAHAATNAIFIQMLYATFFVAGIYLSKQKTGLSFLKWGVLLSSYVVVLFGFTNLFGHASLFAYEDSVMYTNVGLRITSVFQYANTYSAFLLAILFATLVLLVSSRKWAVISISSFMLVPIIVSFSLTLSRGGLLILPIVFIIILPYLKISRQILMGMYFIIAGAVALLISGPITDIGFQMSDPATPSAYGKGFLILFGASAFVSVVLVLIQRFASEWLTRLVGRFTSFRAAGLIIPGFFIVLGVVGVYALFGNSSLMNVLPDNIQQRVENINFAQHSVLERQTFYDNAVDMIKDRPVFGAGGDAWAAMYQAYQTNPYTSNQAHSYYFSYLVETGLFGFLVLAAILLHVFFHFTRDYFRKKSEQNTDRLIFFVIAISILIHSAIDFNMSYVYISSLVFISLGVLASSIRLPAFNSILEVRWVRFYPVALIVLFIVCIIGSTRLVQAHNAFEQVLELQKDEVIQFQEIKTSVDKAIKYSKNPEYLNYKISLLNGAYVQTQDEVYLNESFEVLNELNKSEPYNRSKFENEFRIHILTGNTSKAVEAIERAIELFPWDIHLYNRAIPLLFELGSDPTTDNSYWNKAIHLYQTIKLKEQELSLLAEGQLQGRDFNVTPEMSSLVGQIYFKQGNYEKAEEILSHGITLSLNYAEGRIAARYYIASLLMQNKEDHALYEELLKYDQNEADLILLLIDKSNN